MRLLVIATVAALAAAAFACPAALADTPSAGDEKQSVAPAPRTPAAIRAELYKRLASSRDEDETEGIVGLLMVSYGRVGSDTADLLLDRARKAVAAERYDDAEEILDAVVAFSPGEAEAWNARATARYLDDDYDGAMADIAQTLKREPRHLGALIGMASIFQARGQKREALEIYRRVLTIAPHWKRASEAADKLEPDVEGRPL